MRWRVLFIVSLGVNLALGAVWLVYAHRQSAQLAAARLQASSPALVKTNVLVRRQYFSWDEVESADYPTYVANLREIGCPEQTIRDIIIADVNALYARRLATEVVTSDQQWWRVEPDPEIVEAAAEKSRELDDERRALLARLLGPDWEARDLAGLPRPSQPGVVLDGPVLGVLPEETKEALQGISVRAQERLQLYLEGQRRQGKIPDPVELAKLRQQTREELTRLLTPQQIEEYLLRYSQNAKDLRTELGQLKYLDASAEEFRALFRATDPFDQRLQLLAGSNDPNIVAQRNSLLQQRENALKLALGAGRYEQYVQLRDPVYREAFAAAAEAGEPGAARVLYQINLAAAQQEAAIRAGANLTPEQLAVALQKIKLEQLKAKAQALGQDLPPDVATETSPQLLAPPAQTVPAHPEIPLSVPPPIPVQSVTRPYVLGIGETAISVARQYGLSVDEIRAANPGRNINRLKAGETIRVPNAQPAP